MTHLFIQSPNSEVHSVELPLSKSILNRELILLGLSQGNLNIDDSLWPEDAQLLRRALLSKGEHIDVGHAGTAMRFGLAYFSLQERDITITGSERMTKRPIGILAEALRSLGSSLVYPGAEGFPPVSLQGSKTRGGQAKLSGEISSQFISALLLCGAAMPEGLELGILGPLTSASYVDLTCDVLDKWGVEVKRTHDTYQIKTQSFKPQKLSLELDWSAAAFIYGLVAQGYPQEVLLKGLFLDSVQGDRKVKDYFESLGVRSTETEQGVLIRQIKPSISHFEANLKNEPDLAQAIAFTCAAIGISCRLSGLSTLKIKETDRIHAMQTCLERVGLSVEAGPDYLHLSGAINSDACYEFETYQDHRMAMALSILLPALGELKLDDETVVKKSFPNYWNTLDKMGVASYSKI